MTQLMEAAIAYHHEDGLTVIPIKPRDKAPALDEWECYQTRRSTLTEIRSWWCACPQYNVGLVHGDNGNVKFVSIDVDHDAGALASLRDKFPALLAGRLEQSGGGSGYHIPLIVDALPNLGWDNSKDRPKGNKTWRTRGGDVNIRAQWCQTVSPPSVHPSGGLYKFLQAGPITHLPGLEPLIEYLNTLDTRAAHVSQRIATTQRQPREGNSLDELKRYWPSVVDALHDAGVGGKTQQEPNGEIRILGHGGLIVSEQNGTWYSFQDECGGDVFDAFGWAQFGQSWDRHNREMFRQIVVKMREIAGLAGPETVRASVPAAIGSGAKRARSSYFAG